MSIVTFYKVSVTRLLFVLIIMKYLKLSLCVSVCGQTESIQSTTTATGSSSANRHISRVESVEVRYQLSATVRTSVVRQCIITLWLYMFKSSTSVIYISKQENEIARNLIGSGQGNSSGVHFRMRRHLASEHFQKCSKFSINFFTPNSTKILFHLQKGEGQAQPPVNTSLTTRQQWLKWGGPV